MTTTLAMSERAELSDLLEQLGPDEPTLCEGWQTRDLTAHLILRERRPVGAAVGLGFAPVAARTARLQHELAARDFESLVEALRAGPAKLSPLRLSALGEPANNVEFFVHHEDVRRAQADWKPRLLDTPTDDLLWRRGTRMAPHLLHRAKSGIDLVRAETRERCAVRPRHADGGVVTVTGTSQELMLYMFGRYAHALVDRDGDPTVFATLEKKKLT